VQNLARDQAARLLDESDNLVKLAQDKVEGWQTLDALLLFKSAQEKTSRADVTSQEMSGMSHPLNLSRVCMRGCTKTHTHTHTRTHTHTHTHTHVQTLSPSISCTQTTARLLPCLLHVTPWRVYLKRAAFCSKVPSPPLPFSRRPTVRGLLVAWETEYLSGSCRTWSHQARDLPQLNHVKALTKPTCYA